MSCLTLLFAALRTILLALPLAIAMMIGVLIELSLAPLIWPFFPKVYKKITLFFAKLWWFLAVMCCRLACSKIELLGDEIPAKENALVIANHQTGADITVLLDLAYQKKQLDALKWFTKDTLKYVPFFGWGLYLADGIFVKRSWFKDKNKIIKIFHRILTYKLNFWILCFVEGTRFNPKKTVQSAAFFRAKGMKPLRYVLKPKPSGFIASLEHLRGQTQAVYDLTIIYPTQNPKMRDYFLARYDKIIIHCRRFSISEMPKEAIDDWLLARFQEKDALIESYRKNLNFQ